MCVSAETSFGLTGLLVPAGFYCLKSAWQRERSSLPLAAVPVLFGLQQFCEGLIWVGLGNQNAPLTQSAALAYLFFALVFWLFWIPLSAGMLEPRNKFNYLLGLLALLGLASGLAFYLPILWNPELLVVTSVHHSLCYDFARSPALTLIPQVVWQLGYLAIVSLPFMLVAQKRKGLVALSSTLIVSAVLSHAYFWYAFSSVWCFFAAILSLLLVYAFHHLPMMVTKRSLAALIPRPIAHAEDGR